MASVDFGYLLLGSAIVRVVLVLYGEWQDAHMEVRYTDIDYIVFSDAAALMASGKSPYLRSTYRYSPLLAFVLIPNSIIHRSWGKFLFSASDLLVGVFIRTILKIRKVPENTCMWSVIAWLFNPFTFTIGTRGNCEPVVCAMILWILICLMNGVSFSFFLNMVVESSLSKFPSLMLITQTCKVLQGHLVQAAIWYGLVVHFRIYPIIYALPILLVLDPNIFKSDVKPTIQSWGHNEMRSPRSWCKSRIASIFNPWLILRGLLTKERLLFGFISGSVFVFFTALFYYLYGWEFLHEALLYHLTRTDPRHNFSIYFYHIYLQHERELLVLEKLMSFLPQLIVQLVLVLCFAQDVPFCWFVQTVAFVAFNKVITAQYFVWFFCLLPLVLPWSLMKLKWRGLSCICLWMAAQLHWLMWGYLLEFKAQNVLLQLWMASIVFLASNTYFMNLIIYHHRGSSLFSKFQSGNELHVD